ncbi:hypothetical protein [Mesorhizobium caraganae]|uniref:hypothetical protein n=1 Tax=Mesorhizobium caraganae TaxID=483206 RepID=UPI00177AEBFD|nr:hypothetical protein [Mesorhizobium caraganae]
MAAGQMNFCGGGNYVPAAGVNSRIATSTEDFFDRYRKWEAAGSPSALADMVLYFGDSSRSEEALNKGDGSTGKSDGDVRANHCGAFNDFVAAFVAALDPYTDAELIAFAINPAVRGGGDEKLKAIFEIALRRFFGGVDVSMLTAMEQAVLNGSVFLKADFRPTLIGKGTPEKRLYAIPGFKAFEWEQSLSDPFWIGVDNIVEDAFDQTGSRLVNLNGAAQIRLASVGTTITPIVVAPGFTIKGGQ